MSEDDRKALLILNYINQTIIKDMLYHETVFFNSSLYTDSYLLLKPLQRLVNMVIKSRYKRQHISYLKQFADETVIKMNHKGRIGHFLTVVESMRDGSLENQSIDEIGSVSDLLGCVVQKLRVYHKGLDN